jgi:mannose-6-phosphate isomerase-like protein (cupin superfamily)
LELAPWERMGGKGAYIYLYGMEGTTGMYVAEISAGGALKAEKHLYEEVICILEGNGATEVWQEDGKKQLFEWSQGSVFAPPLNAWHRLLNGSREPAKFLAVTNAPLVMDMYRNLDFVFSCNHAFPDRFAGEEAYFKVGEKRYKNQRGTTTLWETNFIADVRTAPLEVKKVKGPGWKHIQYEMGGNSLIGHIADWPSGVRNKAHYHGPGAVILILRSQGYTLIWPKDAGPQPFANGRGHEVVQCNWQVGSLVCPPGGWFHQHFCTGKEPGRMLAIRYGSRIHPIGFKLAATRQEDGTHISIKEGGTVIEFEDEDPEILRRFQAELRKTGAVMPQVPTA